MYIAYILKKEMLEYRITKFNNSILSVMGKDCRSLNCIHEGNMYWSRKIPEKRTIKEKVEEKLYYDENYVKGCCSYYKEIEETFKDWRDARLECGKFKPYTERNEKITFNKISKHPKPVAIKMLENAIEGAWGKLIELTESELEKIKKPLREEKIIQERKLEGFISEEEKEKSQEEKKRLEQYCIDNPNIRKEAEEYINDNSKGAEGTFRETLIKTRMRMIAKKYL